MPTTCRLADKYVSMEGGGSPFSISLLTCSKLYKKDTTDVSPDNLFPLAMPTLMPT